MKIVLINPSLSSRAEKHWAEYASLGLAYIAASLLEKKNDVLIIDGKIEKLTHDSIVERVIQVRPDLIGLSCMTKDYPEVKKIAYLLKKAIKTPIIIGGAHSNAVKESCLIDCDAIDYCCYGEGEQLMIELVDCIRMGGDFKNISGLIYKKGTNIVINKPRPYYSSYDKLPFPAWHLFPSTSRLPMLTHRGCPFSCIFCCHNSGKIVRNRSVNNVIEELKYIDRNFNVKEIHFVDETFGLDLNRTKMILQEIIKNKLNERFCFTAQTRVDQVDRVFLALLKEANFCTLELGVESGSDKVLTRIGKSISVAQVKEATKLVREEGLKVWCKFILGHPNESIAEMRETVRLISDLNPDRLSVAIMTPYPGTQIYEMAVNGKGGYRLLSTNWKSFDKYTGAALELEDISLAKLKIIQIWCYLRLYLTNLRLLDLFHIVIKHQLLIGRFITILFSLLFKYPRNHRRRSK